MYLFRLFEVVVSIIIYLCSNTHRLYYKVLPPPHPIQVFSRQNANGKMVEKNNKGDLSLNATSLVVSPHSHYCLCSHHLI